MATRSRSSPIDRKSWKSSAAPAAPSLVYYRRAVFSLMLILLLGAFIGLVIWLWRSQPKPWTLMAVTVSEYDKGGLPNLAFASPDAQAIGLLAEGRFKSPSEQPGDLSKLLESLRDESSKKKKSTNVGPLLVWISAHGISDGDEAYLLESDYRIGDSGGSNGARSSRMPLKELLQAVHDHPAPTKLLVLDSGPLERDVQLGMAVNLFPDFLARELENYGDGQFFVLCSHQVLESSQVEPARGRSVFNFYFEQALTSPDANADIQGAARSNGKLVATDKQISLAELASFVSQQVSAHVWGASSRTKLQTPTLIRAGKGTDRGRMDLGSREWEPWTSLDKMHLTKAPEATKEAEAQEPPQEPAKKTSRIIPVRSFPTLALGFQDAGVSAVPLEKSSAKKAPAPKPKSDSTAPAAPKPPAAAKPVFVWTATDSAPHHWRKIEAYLLRGQQQAIQDALPDGSPSKNPLQTHADEVKVLEQIHGGSPITAKSQELYPRVLGDVESFRNYFAGELGAQSANTNVRNALVEDEFRMAVQLRDEILQDLPAWIDLADRLSTTKTGEQTQTASELWLSLLQEIDSRLRVLRQELERHQVYQATKPADEKGLVSIPADVFDEKTRACDLAKLAEAAVSLRKAQADVLGALKQFLTLGKRPTLAAQADFWAVSQTVQLGEAELRAVSDSIKQPRTGNKLVVRELPLATPTPQEAGQIRAARWKQRLEWLTFQQGLLSLATGNTPGGLPHSANPDDEKFRSANSICRKLRTDCERLPGDVRTDIAAKNFWKADVSLRLLPAQIVDRLELRKEENPLANLHIPIVPRPVLLSLRGPLDLSGNLLGDKLELTLKDRDIYWILGGNRKPPQGMKYQLEYDARLAEVRDRQGNVIPANTPQSLEGQSAPWDQKLNRLVFAVRAAQLSPPPSTPLRLTLLLDPAAEDEKKLDVDTEVFLPSDRWLDLFVEGQPGTIHDGDVDESPLAAEHAPAPLTTAWNRYRVATQAADRGQSMVRLRLTPFSRGSCEYGLNVVNRFSAERKLQMRMISLPLDSLTMGKWQNVLESALASGTVLVTTEPKAVKPGESANIPFFPEMKPAAAGAPAPAPPSPAPPPDISNGLVCEISDLTDPKVPWKQYIWITARCQNPQKYLKPFVQFQRQPESRIAATFQPVDVKRVPAGPSTLKWNHEVFIQPAAPADLSKGQSLNISTLVPREAIQANAIETFLDCDGYPRAFFFRIDVDATEVKKFERTSRLKLELSQPGKEQEWSPLAPEDVFFRELKQVRATLMADVPFPVEYSATHFRFQILADSAQVPQPSFEDRVHQIQMTKPPTAGNFLLTGEVLDLHADFNFKDVPTSRRIKISAKAEALLVPADSRLNDGQVVPLARAIYTERELVIDRDEPRVTGVRALAKSTPLGQDIELEVEVMDQPDDESNSASGVPMNQIQWSLKSPKIQIKQAKDPWPELLDTSPALANSQELARAGRPIRFKVPASVAGTMLIWVQATDQAGNRSEAKQIAVKVTDPKDKAKIGKGLPILLPEEKKK